MTTRLNADGGPRAAMREASATVRRARIDTPVGALLAEARGGALTALTFVDAGANHDASAPGAAAVRDHLRADADAPLDADPALASIARELQEYFAGRSARFRTPLAPEGTQFQQRVWRALLDIPPGATRSYAQVARAVGAPDAVRAVGRANGANPIAIVVPCHRVIRADGALCGYAGGVRRKRVLLDLEARAWGQAATQPALVAS